MRIKEDKRQPIREKPSVIPQPREPSLESWEKCKKEVGNRDAEEEMRPCTLISAFDPKIQACFLANL